MKVTVEYQSPISAPITAGQSVGTLTIEAPDFETIEVPLLAATDSQQLGMVGSVLAQHWSFYFGGQQG